MNGPRVSTQLLRRFARPALQLVAALAAGVYLVYVIVTTVAAPRPAPVPPTVAGARFGVALETRQKLYGELLRQAARFRRNARMVRRRPYNQEMIFLAQVAHFVARSAPLHSLSPAQVWLIVDEGIRNHWTIPGFAPLPVRVVPLSLKTR